MNGSEYVDAHLSAAKRLAAEVVRLCREKGLHVTTAESCTGGLISELLTGVSGCSAVLELCLCTYSNDVKSRVLGVSAQTLERYTEYSHECADEMIAGALRVSDADVGISTTGIAGPDGGTESDPVGTVYIGVCGADGHIFTERYCVDTDKGGAFTRELVRAAAAERGLSLLVETLEKGEKNG